jgi:ketosteroid isomerase-like protein
MSHENVEKVRFGFEALRADDIERMLTVIDPAIELLPLSGKYVERRTYRGHEGVREWDRLRRETWHLEFCPERYEAIGDRVVVVDGSLTSRGVTSGVELDTAVSWLFELRDGKITRLEAFLDHDEALAAARKAAAPGS